MLMPIHTSMYKMPNGYTTVYWSCLFAYEIWLKLMDADAKWYQQMPPRGHVKAIRICEISQVKVSSIQFAG